jgi:hypothetical protein
MISTHDLEAEAAAGGRSRDTTLQSKMSAIRSLLGEKRTTFAHFETYRV